MADNASRRGAASSSMALMVLAFAVIGGFMYWLNGQASKDIAERQAYADSVRAAEEEERNRPPMIDPERIQLDASGFEGQNIRLSGVPVASNLGSQGYWLEMPNGNPFLISMASSVPVEGGPIDSGDEVEVTGQILAINDSVLTAWSSAGTVSDGDRLAAEFATHFMEVLELRVLPDGDEN